jgi:hypothetical protein
MGGPGVVTAWRAGTGKREGGPGRGTGQRSGTAALSRYSGGRWDARGADTRDRHAGSGVRGARRAVTGCGARTTRSGADTRAPQHSVARFGFQTESNLFQTDSNLPQTESNLFQTDSNLLQTLTDPKGAFPCSKNWK